MRTLSISIFAFLWLAACGGSTVDAPSTETNTAETTRNSGDELAAHDCGGVGGIACGEGQFCDLGSACRQPDAMGTCRVITPMCTREYRPVCGCDGQTYPTACVAHASSVSVLHDGECASAEPTSTSEGDVGRSCGSRGQAPCAGGTVCVHEASAHCGETDAPGTCQVRPQMCPMNYDPVCGCDGHTFSNACAAAAAGVSVRVRGECATPPR